MRFSSPLPGSPKEIVPIIARAGLKGIVARRRDSKYDAGTRSLAWRKFRLARSQEFVIGGYNPDGKTFSSILAGYYEGKQLMFAGKVRQGFRPASRNALFKKLQPLKTERCPFVNLPINKRGHFGEGVTTEDMAGLQWLRPKLVAQIGFTEWTTSGMLRHATFMGLRDDKAPTEVIREV